MHKKKNRRKEERWSNVFPKNPLPLAATARLGGVIVYSAIECTYTTTDRMTSKPLRDLKQWRCLNRLPQLRPEQFFFRNQSHVINLRRHFELFSVFFLRYFNLTSCLFEYSRTRRWLAQVSRESSRPFRTLDCCKYASRTAGVPFTKDRCPTRIYLGDLRLRWDKSARTPHCTILSGLIFSRETHNWIEVSSCFYHTVSLGTY